MTYGSVYEITNPLSKVAGQHFIDDIGTGKWNAKVRRWVLENVNGSGTLVGSGNGTDGGYLIRSSSGGTDQTHLTFDDKNFCKS